MKMRLLLAGLLMACVPVVCAAQDTKVKTKTKDDGTVKVKKEVGGVETKVKYKSPPAWAAAKGYNNNMHVYFPDYYTFYDPTRGYIYWDGDSWETSATVPAFISTVDLNTARMEILNDAAIDVRPETTYDVYVRQYPAQPVTGVTIMVPPMR